MKTRIAVLTAALLATACATTDDPRKGGFISGVAGLNSGAYERRLEEREDRLQGLKEIQGELRAEQADLQSEKLSKEQQIRNLQGRLAKLDRDTKALMRDIRSKRSQLAGERDKRAQLERDLGQLQQQIDTVEKKAGSGGSVQQLEAERAQLEQEYRTLLDLSLQLGK